MTARPAGAAALGIAVTILLIAGGTPVPPAFCFGLGAALFTAWRTIPGIEVALAFTLLASILAAPSAPLLRVAASLSPLLLPLELYGWLTALFTRHPSGARPSLRLLGAWAASSGCMVMGVALTAGDPARAAGTVLVCVALAYRLGAIPAFGWGPLLLRHPSNRVAPLGAIGLLLSAAALVMATSRFPGLAVARRTDLVLAALAIPYTVRHAMRQWHSDRRCAWSYVAASGSGLLLLILSIAS
jgi:hypothetical protein